MANAVNEACEQINITSTQENKTHTHWMQRDEEEKNHLKNWTKAKNATAHSVALNGARDACISIRLNPIPDEWQIIKI